MHLTHFFTLKILGLITNFSLQRFSCNFYHISQDLSKRSKKTQFFDFSWNCILDKVFKNGPSKICGRQPLKNLKKYDLLKAVFHKFYFVHFWTLCPIWIQAAYFFIFRIT